MSTLNMMISVSIIGVGVGIYISLTSENTLPSHSTVIL